ncbi:sigma 54 modulation/S30EA ribosomal C-terminal domain-containing protein [Streptomyces sp. WMMB 322]|uniref:sigma 54 modulation/S30EA ribosomal C-terminal domain-containing protein n=1 Tax=Streptomyces sp. WMMB 322 TaxID=1286821 RepID=UPI0006E323B8|nr:sigma 54 modulation/S30EA ribosomal C-terminal domain-containing protein [Streptomyces sp. WMMB 322]SCK43698.1 Sigma 54 modulation/S30EA ribosomal protein C terminus [Streptomyces sp. WMMB 322]
MRRTVQQRAPEIQVATRGELSPDAADYAQRKVQALLSRAPEPVLYGRVRLTRTANPATRRPVTAQASLDVNGRVARAQVAGRTATEAADLLHDRLGERLDRLARNWEARRGGMPVSAPNEWRHLSEPTHHPDYFPRPPEERQVVRHKSFTLDRETPDEAAFELEMMDYGFQLFTDIGTGEDSVLYRAGPTGYRLAQLHPRPLGTETSAVPLTVSDLPAPRLTVDEARERLDLAGFPFVFFADAATGRGSVLYHRYDGHYGLVTPAE